MKDITEWIGNDRNAYIQAVIELRVGCREVHQGDKSFHAKFGTNGPNPNHEKQLWFKSIQK